MVALVVSLVAALSLGLTSWVPRILERDIGVADVAPGLLEVAQDARGVQSLGAGLSVALYDSGFRLARGSTVLADTVTRGAPVTAVMGTLDQVNGHPREEVTGTLMHVRINAVRRVKDTVRYSGVVHDDTTSMPLRIDFQPIDGRIRMDAAVPGADAVAIHLDWRPATVGIAPALPEQNLREGAYWVDPTVVEQPAFTWVLGTDVSIAPVQVPACRRPAPGRPDRRARVGSTGRGHRHGHPSRHRGRLELMSTPVSPTPLQRVAMVTVHTSPLAQPGEGDAGGMNVYVLEVARQLARRGIAVDLFTRTTSASQPAVVEVEPGVVVRHVPAGPYEGLSKEDLPGQLCAFAAGMMRVAAHAPPGYYDLVHSHYWLSGQVGWLAADRWGVPLVHTMHTMARVKNLHLADGDLPEPMGREIGEAQVVEAADRLVANTEREARELVDLYDADPDRVVVAEPGVDLAVFHPGSQLEARAAVGVPSDAVLLLFVGRIQPLKAPDVLVKAAAELVRRRPDLRSRVVVAILGGASGTGVRNPMGLTELAEQRGIGDLVRFVPPVDRQTLAQWYRAADVLAVPSHNESFGLVAVEAQACGTPVVAANVGGLPTAVGSAGILVDGHDTADWATAIAGVVLDPERRAGLSRASAEHAAAFGWARTAERLAEVYADAMALPREASINEAETLTGIPQAVIP